MARSESQSLANCVIDSPSPPGQSPTVTRGEADLRVLGAPRLDHPVERGLAHQVGGEAGPRWRESRADRRRYAAAPRDSCRCGSAAAVATDGADHVGVERPSPRLGVEVLDPRQRPDAGGVHRRVDAAESGRGLHDRAAARRLVGHVAPDRQHARAGFLGRLDQAVVPARQRARPRPPLRQSDADAAPHPLDAPMTTALIAPPRRPVVRAWWHAARRPSRTAASTSPITQVRPRIASSGGSSQSTTIRS